VCDSEGGADCGEHDGVGGDGCSVGAGGEGEGEKFIAGVGGEDDTGWRSAKWDAIMAVCMRVGRMARM
jgi:hypothetical protein